MLGNKLTKPRSVCAVAVSCYYKSVSLTCFIRVIKYSKNFKKGRKTRKVR